ncbi:M10 family metallopeptidase [Rubellimicrobium rubrum]|nr:M10 family metallopeptidase [Rubellimicrobium rubrum]
MSAQNGSNSELIKYLVEGFWQDRGQIARDWTTTDIIEVDLTGLDREGAALARAALSAWESVADLEFEEVDDGGHIRFTDSGLSATTSGDHDANGHMNWATVAIGRSWLDFSGTKVGTYAFQVYLHEIGHALGLGHPAQYRGSDNFKEALFRNDSWQQSVMSYFDQDENPNVSSAAFPSFVITPMMADIAAIQRIYGAPKGGATAGDTVYGVGTNLVGYLGDMFQAGSSSPAKLARNVMTVYDEGGHDRLDFSDDPASQRVDLRKGMFSTVYGHKDCLGIAQGTVIEDYSAGSGADWIGGNAAANRLRGGGGADVIRGRDGADTIDGGSGDDSLCGGRGRDLLMGGAGDDTYVQDSSDRLVERAGQGFDTIVSRGSARLPPEFEALRLIGASAAWGTGNDAANRIVGNKGSNVLAGLAGDDDLIGGPGRDRLLGGSGQDRLSGGLGRDILDGGNDRDRDVFIFTSAAETLAGREADVIRGFVPGVDDLDLQRIGAGGSAAHWNGNLAFADDGPAAYSVWWAAGSDGVTLRGDVSGDGRADFEIRILGIEALGAGDILL